MVEQVVDNPETEEINCFQDPRFVKEVFSTHGKDSIYKASYKYFSPKIHASPKPIAYYVDAFYGVIERYSEETKERDVIVTDDGQVFGEVQGLSFIGTKEQVEKGMTTWPRDNGFLLFLWFNILLMLGFMALGIAFALKGIDMYPEPIAYLIGIILQVVIVSAYVLRWYYYHPTRLKRGHWIQIINEFFFVGLTLLIYDMINEGYFPVFEDFGTAMLYFGPLLVYIVLFYLYHKYEPGFCASSMSKIWLRYRIVAKFDRENISELDTERILNLTPTSLWYEYHLALDVKRISIISARPEDARLKFLKLQKEVATIGRT